jgi:fructokinase
VSVPPVEIVALGQVLWDLLPSGKALGGAPFNFAFHCHQLGRRAAFVSRVGRDELGREARAAVRALGMDDAFLQDDDSHPTGTVTVELEGGQPRYTIHENVAFDHLAAEPRLLDLVARANVVCFGTLCLRAPVSRDTIQRLVRAASGAIVVCDLNLRQQFYSPEIVESSLRASRWLKLNDDELRVLAEMFRLPGRRDSAKLANLRKRFALELVALTRGAQGALVQTLDEEVAVPGVAVAVADTVGAGDAFTAGLAVRVLEGAAVAEAAAFANRLAALVATRPGGTPRIDRAEVEAGLSPAP